MAEPITKDIVVFYHGGCRDGFTAAWAAWKKFGDTAQYFPVHYGEPFPGNLFNKEIYLLDFTPDKVSVLEKLVADNKKVVGVDHHKTSELKMLVMKERVFDLSKSGAMLAWEYFHPDKIVPVLIKYVQDYDLWTWKLPDTRQITSRLDLFSWNFESWNETEKLMEDEKQREKIKQEGELIITHEDLLAKRVISGVQLVNFEGNHVLAVNCPIMPDRIGQLIYGNHPPFAIIWSEDSSSIGVSLRSDGSFNVGELAKKYGGGGHPGSAGFTLALGTPLPWKVIQEKI